MPRELNPQRIHDEVMAIIEFAWIAGLLNWSANEYESAVHQMFAKSVDTKAVIERSKFAHRKNEERSKTLTSLTSMSRGHE